MKKEATIKIAIREIRKMSAIEYGDGRTFLLGSLFALEWMLDKTWTSPARFIQWRRKMGDPYNASTVPFFPPEKPIKLVTTRQFTNPTTLTDEQYQDAITGK